MSSAFAAGGVVVDFVAGGIVAVDAEVADGADGALAAGKLVEALVSKASAMRVQRDSFICRFIQIKLFNGAVYGWS